MLLHEVHCSAVRLPTCRGATDYAVLHGYLFPYRCYNTTLLIVYRHHSSCKLGFRIFLNIDFNRLLFALRYSELYLCSSTFCSTLLYFLLFLLHCTLLYGCQFLLKFGQRGLRVNFSCLPYGDNFENVSQELLFRISIVVRVPQRVPQHGKHLLQHSINPRWRQGLMEVIELLSVCHELCSLHLLIVIVI